MTIPSGSPHEEERLGLERLYPVILAGGSGERLWPLSTSARPKQFLKLTGDTSLLQATLLRVADVTAFEPPMIAASLAHREALAADLFEIGLAQSVSLLLEPIGRNTGLAVAVAAVETFNADPDAVMLVLPADHAISDTDSFRRTIDEAARTCRLAGGPIMLIGVPPSHPATEFGYIEYASGGQVSRVVGFKEKPDRAEAEAFVLGGRHLWNCGMLLAPAWRLMAELEAHAPDVLAAARRAVAEGARDGRTLSLSPRAYEQAPSAPFDKLVLEKSSHLAVVRARFGWSDVGSWSAVQALAPADDDGNRLVGPVAALGCGNSYIRSEGPTVAVLGLQDVCVVATAGSVLVAHASHETQIKAALATLKAGGAGSPAVEHRPWGRFETVARGPGFAIKTIVVDPGQRLSLQRHAHRDEHWVVVKGAALARLGTEEVLLAENQGLFIPSGEVHRLANPTAEPLVLVEIQYGKTLSEGDIERLEDDYGRLEPVSRMRA